ncbi:hypothetical protein D1007_13180 [Hordeum vulgare]|nr:hypothetical protein D1007_13180 [Hordeum vulgare]
MSGREVREYTNLSDPKDRKYGKGKDKIDDEDVTFQRMVAKMQDVAGERGGYLHGRGALDSDDLLYLKEQMEAEEDAERLLRPAVLADSAPAIPAALRVEPRPKSDIRQRDLLKKIVEIKPKRAKVSSPRQTAEGDRPKQEQEDSVRKMSTPGNQPESSEGEKGPSQGAVSFLQPLSKPGDPAKAQSQNAARNCPVPAPPRRPRVAGLLWLAAPPSSAAAAPPPPLLPAFCSPATPSATGPARPAVVRRRRPILPPPEPQPPAPEPPAIAVAFLPPADSRRPCLPTPDRIPAGVVLLQQANCF